MFRVLIFFMSILPAFCFAYSKPILGPYETFSIEEGNIHFVARIDTGASNSSLHAFDMHVVGGEAKRKKDNIGKMLRFSTENRDGKRVELQAPIVDVSTVKNAQGTESRYMVELTLNFAGDARKVRVNLRDRGHMDFRMLIGRNWLEGHYLVNVQQLPVIGARAPIHIVESDLTYDARIDTGAVENSLHATHIHIHDADKDNMENNVGKLVTFTTANEHGQSAEVTTRIADTSLIRNAQGSEIRYMVELTLGEPGKEYKVLVNLKDRTKMRQKLLIGRNWLEGHYLVDVDK
ncbi:RimK/LysX family protein [Shewanella sp. GXUN23E]|uniref:putative ATP-dependent zinc protease n=1 Tax=Shewanella sp. GXUN23E TaxID=3422498 RepID=UPI003D7DC61D